MNLSLKHRHSTTDCNPHYFCVGEKLPVMEDKDIFNALIMPKDFEDIQRLIKLDTKYGGELNWNSIKQNPNLRRLFNKDAEFPKDKKILVSEEEMDRWIASHYGISLENVPYVRPMKMPEDIYNRLKVYANQKKAKRDMKQ
jgi:hypothetical protein